MTTTAGQVGDAWFKENALTAKDCWQSVQEQRGQIGRTGRCKGAVDDIVVFPGG